MKVRGMVNSSLGVVVLSLIALALGCGSTETFFGAGGSTATATGAGTGTSMDTGGSGPCAGGQELCGPICRDTKTDATNCGACGVDCGGEACV